MKIFLSLCPAQALAPLPDFGDKQKSPFSRRQWTALGQGGFGPWKEWDLAESVLGEGATETSFLFPPLAFPPGTCVFFPTPCPYSLVMEHHRLGSRLLGQSLLMECTVWHLRHPTDAGLSGVTKEYSRRFMVQKGAFMKAWGQDLWAGRAALIIVRSDCLDTS